jgi:hypothetical protein
MRLRRSFVEELERHLEMVLSIFLKTILDCVFPFLVSGSSMLDSGEFVHKITRNKPPVGDGVC